MLEPDELRRARSLYDAQAAELRAHPKPSVCGLVDREMSPFDVSVQAIADVQEDALKHRFAVERATLFTRPFRHPRASGNGRQRPGRLPAAASRLPP